MKKFIIFCLYEAWAISSYFFVQSRSPQLLEQPFGVVLWLGFVIAPIVVLLVRSVLNSDLSAGVRILNLFVVLVLFLAFCIFCANALLQMFPDIIFIK